MNLGFILPYPLGIKDALNVYPCREVILLNGATYLLCNYVYIFDSSANQTHVNLFDSCKPNPRLYL